jgi:hypothetical protein
MLVLLVGRSRCGYRVCAPGSSLAGEVKTLNPQRGVAAISGGVWLAAAAARGVGERIFIAASTSETRNL